MRLQSDSNPLHCSWYEPPVEWIPYDANNYGEQLIAHSINLATVLNSQVATEPSAIFPWGFVEARQDRIQNLASSAGLLINECLALLGPGLPQAIRAKTATPEQLRLDTALRDLNPNQLRALATGITIDGDVWADGTKHGETIPPWERAGPGAPIIDQLAQTLRALMEYTPLEFAVTSLFFTPMAWAAYVDPIILFVTHPILHPRIRNGVTVSAINAVPGSMARVTREFQARDTWEKCRWLANAVLKLKTIQIPTHVIEEIHKLLATEKPVSQSVHRVLHCLETILQPAWRDSLRQELERQQQQTLYLRKWDKSWGPKSVLFLEMLRKAGQEGVLIADIKQELKWDPSKILNAMLRKKYGLKLELGKHIQELRKTRNDGRYYLY